MMYIAAFVCVSEYFLTKRPLATSISSCGSSAGTFVFGFLYRVCIDHYGWRGALLVFAGLMLNGVVCGALFRPFVDKAADKFCKHNSDSFKEHVTQKTDHHSHQNDVSHLDRQLNKICHDEKSIHDDIEKDKETTDLQSEHTASDDSIVNKTMLAAEKEHLLEDRSHMELYNGNVIENLIGSQSDMYSIPVVKADMQMVDSATPTPKPASTVDMPNKGKQQSKIRSTVMAVLGTTNLDIFRDWKFLLFGLSTFLYCFGYGIPFVLLPDMAELNGK